MAISAEGLLALVAVLIIATALALFERSRRGRFAHSEDYLAWRDRLGEDLGSEVTFVQFSSAFCAPCRATRLVLADIAESEAGVKHVEIDAESHLELVREVGILSTPTTIVLNGDGQTVARSVGAPRRDQVLTLLQGIRNSRSRE